jgi:outer membrane protein insertion porin family
MAFGFDIFANNYDYRASSGFGSAGYEDAKYGGSLRLGFALTDEFYLNTNYTLLQDNVYNVDANASAAVQQIKGTALISSVGYSLIYDTRNNKKNPSRGFYFQFTQDGAGAGGDVDYVRSVAEFRGYYPITKEITLVGHAIGGDIFGYNGQNVRIVDSFYKGGETIRGFQTAGLGPRDAVSGDALGGNMFYAGTVEVRFPIPLLPDELGFGGAIFADAGSVWGTDAKKVPGVQVQDSDALRTSVGASLIWNSPVGPLRADFAYVINKEAFDKTQFFRFGAASRF